MGFWDQMGIGLRALAIVCAAVIGLWLMKAAATGMTRMIERLLRPVESRTLQWLQDRAMSKALGVDVDIIRARRRIETANEPIDVPTAEGAKHHR